MEGKTPPGGPGKSPKVSQKWSPGGTRKKGGSPVTQYLPLAASGRLGFAPSRARRVRNVLRSQAGSRIPRGPLFLRKITFFYDGRAQTCLPKFREVNIAPFPSGERSLKGRDANALLFRGLGNRVFRDPSSPNATVSNGFGSKIQNREKRVPETLPGENAIFLLKPKESLCFYLERVRSRAPPQRPEYYPFQ